MTKDKAIKEYLLKGKKLAEKQVEIINKVLKADGLDLLIKRGWIEQLPIDKTK